MAVTTRTRSSNRRTTTPVQAHRRHLLDVRVRQTTARRMRFRTIMRWTWNLTVLCALIVGSFFSFRAIINKFFLENTDYNLASVSVNEQPLITVPEIMAMTGVEKGHNIFLIDLTAIEKALSAIPEVEKVAVRRELPDSLKITVQLRHPVAWVSEVTTHPSASPAKLIDQTSHIFQPSKILPSYFQLPIISGIRPEDLTAGDVLHLDELRRAIELIHTLRLTPDSLLVIRSVDISKGWIFEVMDQNNTQILFAPTGFSAQLEKLQLLLQHARETGRELESINLMPKRNTPVRYALSARADRNNTTEP